MEDAWSRRIGEADLGGICASFRTVMSSLYEWKKTHFGSVPARLNKCRKKMEELMLDPNNSNCDEKKRLTAEMDKLLYREELMWMQRSHIAWLKEGDRNTRFFHRKASRRMKKNKIHKLKRPDGPSGLLHLPRSM